MDSIAQVGLFTFWMGPQDFQLPIIESHGHSDADAHRQTGAESRSENTVRSMDIEINGEAHDEGDNVINAKAPLRLYDCEHEILKDQRTYHQETDNIVPPYIVASQVWGEIRHQMVLPTVEWTVAISDPAKWDMILGYCKTNGRVKWLWMDAICINQGNNPEAEKEKAIEIPKMKYYYRGALACLVVPHDYLNFPLAYARLVDLSVSIMDAGASVQDNAQRIWESIALLNTVIGDEWFWRVWTYQELLLPNKHVLCDGQELDVDILRRLLDWYHKILRNGTLKKPTGGIEYDYVHPDNEMVISAPRNWQSRNLRNAMKKKLVQDGHVDLVSLIYQTSLRESMYPVDRLLGLYGLLSDDEKVPIKPSEMSDRSSSTAPLEAMWARMISKAVVSGRVWPLLHDFPEPDAAEGTKWMPRITAPAPWGERISGSALTRVYPETVHYRNNEEIKITENGLHIAVRVVGCIIGTSAGIGDGSGEAKKIIACTWSVTTDDFNTDPIVQQLKHGLATSDIVAQDEIEGSQNELHALLHTGSLLDI